MSGADLAATAAAPARRRAVFLDVDGTLIEHDGTLAPSVVSAVRGARAAGHLVFTCTGRSRAEMPAEVEQIGFDGAITAGGGFTELGGELVAERTMDPALVAEILALLELHDIEFVLQAYDSVVGSPGLVERLRPVVGDLAEEWLGGFDVHRAHPDGGGDPVEGVAKVTFFGKDPRTFRVVRDALGDRFHVISGTMPYLGEAGGEISLHGVHKGAAIARLVELIGVPMADVVGIGDSVNDLEMLEMSGLGIAMGNADAAVKAVADEVTHAVDADGVWSAFVRHGLVPGDGFVTGEGFVPGDGFGGR